MAWSQDQGPGPDSLLTQFAIRANRALSVLEISWSNLLPTGEETQSHSNSPNTIQCAPFNTTKQQNTYTFQERPRGRHFHKHIKDQVVRKSRTRSTTGSCICPLPERQRSDDPPAPSLELPHPPGLMGKSSMHGSAPQQSPTPRPRGSTRQRGKWEVSLSVCD